MSNLRPLRKWPIHHRDGAGMTRQAFLLQMAAAGGGLLFLEGCGDSAAEQTSEGAAEPPRQPTGTLRVANFAEPTTLDPARAATAADYVFALSIWEGLVTYNDDYTELVPELAESWTQSDDGKEWTFQLCQGVKYHDGAPFDSTAVRKTFEYYRKQTGTFASLLLPAEIAEMDDSDPAVFRIATKAPYADMARHQTVTRMLSPQQLERGPNAIARQPVGTGQFRFVEQDRNRAVILEVNEEYWGDRAYLERIEFPVVTDLNARQSALISDQIDVSLTLPPDQFKQAESDTREVRTASLDDSWRVGWLNFITNQTPVDEVRVRQAVIHAIDRDAIAKTVLRGLASVADSFMPPGIPGYKPPETQYPYDPDRAQALLREAGHPDGVSFRMAAPRATVIASQQISQAIVAQLAEVGIRAELDILEDAVFSQDFFSEKPKYQVSYNNFTWLTGSALWFVLGLVSSSKLASSRITELTTRLNSLPDGEERNAAIAGLQEALAEEVPQVALFYHDSLDATRADVHGYEATREAFRPNFAKTFVASQ